MHNQARYGNNPSFCICAWFAFSQIVCAHFLLRSEEELDKVTAQSEIRSSTAAIFFRIYI